MSRRARIGRTVETTEGALREAQRAGAVCETRLPPSCTGNVIDGIGCDGYGVSLVGAANGALAAMS